MRAYLFLLSLLFVSSCAKDEDMITFEISVVNANTKMSLKEGHLILYAFKDPSFFSSPVVLERKVMLDEDQFMIPERSIQGAKYFEFQYFNLQGASPGNKVVGCTNISEVEYYTCIAGQNKYAIEIQVFD